MTLACMIVSSFALLAWLAPAALAADLDAIVAELRERADRVEAFEVKMTYGTVPAFRGDARSDAVRRVLFKVPDHYRAEAWIETEDADGARMLMQDQARVEGRTVDYDPDGGSATIHDVRKPSAVENAGEYVLLEVQLFPLLMRRVFERAERVAIKVDEAAGELTLRWEAPEGNAGERHITATFALDPPHEPLSLSHHDGESGWVWHAQFSGHRMEGPGIPVATEVLYQHVSDEEIVRRKILFTIEGVTINEPIPDSAFEIDLPPGTRVTDYNLEHTYIVGEEVGASE